QYLALQLAELLVAARVEILEILVLVALQVALRVLDLALEAEPLLLAHHRLILLEAVLRRLELLALRDDRLLARLELLLQLVGDDFRLRRVLEQLADVDHTDLEIALGARRARGTHSGRERRKTEKTER